MDMQYCHTSRPYARTREEKLQLKSDLLFHREMAKEQLIEDLAEGVKRPGALLLDSSLISEYKKKGYNYKIIECGDYYYIYKFPYRIKNDSNLEKMKDYRKIDINNLFKEEDIPKSRGDPDSLKKIELKNIYRSRFEMQRLAKTNEKIFKTFITLTFKNNVTDIKKAHKMFHNWTCNIRKKKSDFAYIAVPEFQKRGALHYHLLTNLDVLQNHDIIIPQINFSDKQYKKMTSEQRRKCYDVIYWPHGFTSVMLLHDILPVAYLSKYMTKDIDNRLWGHRRYYYSQNLIKPTVNYIDSSNLQEFTKIIDVLDTSEVVFTSSYYDQNKNKVEFIEYKKKGYN